MRPTPSEFCERYGPWAVVAGASEGLGVAFADALAARGLHLILLARRAGLLAEVAERLQGAHGVEVRPLVQDLGEPGFGSALSEATRTLEVGTLVYNAALSPVGPFLDQPADTLTRALDVNVRGPLLAVRTLAPAMRARGRGGIVLMSSLAGLQGSPRITTYAATKAFNTILAEGLWGELAGDGIDVLVSVAGAIRTPGYLETSGGASREAPGTLDPSDVAEQTLAALGRGPRVVPGAVNRIASWLTGRVLPRRAAIRLMAANTRDLS